MCVGVVIMVRILYCVSSAFKSGILNMLDNLISNVIHSIS